MAAEAESQSSGRCLDLCRRSPPHRLQPGTDDRASRRLCGDRRHRAHRHRRGYAPARTASAASVNDVIAVCKRATPHSAWLFCFGLRVAYVSDFIQTLDSILRWLRRGDATGTPGNDVPAFACALLLLLLVVAPGA